MIGSRRLVHAWLACTGSHLVHNKQSRHSNGCVSAIVLVPTGIKTGTLHLDRNTRFLSSPVASSGGQTPWTLFFSSNDRAVVHAAYELGRDPFAGCIPAHAAS